MSETSTEYGMISRTLDTYPITPWTADNLAVVIVNKMWSRSPMTEDEIEAQFDWVEDKSMLHDAINIAVSKGRITRRVTYYMSASQRKQIRPRGETLD